jgi:hypothetical protein
MSLLIKEANYFSKDEPMNQSLSLIEESPEIDFFAKSDDIGQVKENFFIEVISKFKNEESLTLKDKLEFSYLLSLAISSFNEEMIKELNEEECHLSLLNWVWRYRKKIKEFRNIIQNKNSLKLIPNFIYFFSNKYNKLLIEINFIIQLLINILNILYFLPITSSELLNLKLYEKLSKIKEYIKPFVQKDIVNLNDIILLRWKELIDLESEQKIIAKFKLNKLGIKRIREEKIAEQTTETDSTDNDTIINIETNINNNIIINNNKKINLNKKFKNKKIKVSFDLSRNSVIKYNKDDMPFQITLEKQKNKDNKELFSIS